MFKNTASQKLTVFAWDVTTGLPKTGDAANLTAYVSKDDGSVTALGDTSATEQSSSNAPGYYVFDLTQAETNADKLMFSAKSSTSNIAVLAVPSVVYTVPANFTKTVIDSSGLVDANAVKVGPSGSGTAQTARDLGASVLLSSGTGTGQISLSSGKVLLQATQTGVTIPTVTTLTNAPSDSSGITTLLSRIPSGLFTGITSLAQWLGLLAGKQAGNATALTELKATGAGSGTYDPTTDSQEAIRDRGDAAWPTATGFSTLDAADVRAAVGLANADLDDQIAALPTDADVNAQVDAALADYDAPTKAELDTAVASLATASALSTVDGVVDAIKAKTDNLPSDPADESLIIAATDALSSLLGTPAGASVSADIAAAKADTAAIKAVTDNLPDSGALSSLAQGSALSVVGNTAGAIKAVTDELPDAGALTSLATAASVAALPSAADVADAVWDETAADHDTEGSTGAALGDAGGSGTPPTASEIADAVWDEALSGHTTEGTAGDTLGNVATGTPPSASAIADAVLDEALSGHATTGTLGKAISDTATAAAAVQAKTDTLPASPAAVGSAMTLTSAYDAAKTAAKAGDAMALTSGERTTLAAAIWAALTSGLTTAGSIGKKLADWVLGTDHKALVSSDAHTGGVTVAAVTGNVGGNVTGTIGGLSTQAKADVNAEADAAISDAALATAANLATAKTAIDAVKAKTDALPASPAAVGSAMTLTAAYEAAKTAAQAGDAMTLTSAYDAAKAAASATNLAAVKTVVDAVQAKTDTLPASPAASGDVPSAATVAAAVLTAAEATPIEANVKQINDTTLTGDGVTTPVGAAS